MVHSRVLVALVLCSYASFVSSFSCAPLHHVSRRSLSTNGLLRGPPALNVAMGAIIYQGARLPANPQKEKCACGSGLTYDRCCGEWHDRGEPPADPIILIKTRYSAYAYCLPEYIMATTAPDGPEYNLKRSVWDAQLRDFSKTYSFKKLSGDLLGVKIEECKFWDPLRASVRFKATMINADNKLVEFWERATLIREKEDAGWLYLKGTLLEFKGPLV